MHIFTCSPFNKDMVFKRLSDNPQYLDFAANLAEQEWGYVRLFKGVEYRKSALTHLLDRFYVGVIGDTPVAMFALLDHQPETKTTKTYPDLPSLANKLPKMKELWYVAVASDYRGLGISRKIIDKAKQLARQENAELILLDILKYKLANFYQKHQGDVVAEGRLLGHPTDIMTLKL